LNPVRLSHTLPAIMNISSLRTHVDRDTVNMTVSQEGRFAKVNAIGKLHLAFQINRKEFFKSTAIRSDGCLSTNVRPKRA